MSLDFCSSAGAAHASWAFLRVFSFHGLRRPLHLSDEPFRELDGNPIRIIFEFAVSQSEDQAVRCGRFGRARARGGIEGQAVLQLASIL